MSAAAIGRSASPRLPEPEAIKIDSSAIDQIIDKMVLHDVVHASLDQSSLINQVQADAIGRNYQLDPKAMESYKVRAAKIFQDSVQIKELDQYVENISAEDQQKVQDKIDAQVKTPEVNIAPAKKQAEEKLAMKLAEKAILELVGKKHLRERSFDKMKAAIDINRQHYSAEQFQIHQQDLEFFRKIFHQVKAEEALKLPSQISDLSGLNERVASLMNAEVERFQKKFNDLCGLIEREKKEVVQAPRTKALPEQQRFFGPRQVVQDEAPAKQLRKGIKRKKPSDLETS